MEPLIWILLPGFTAVASGLLAWFIMQSRMEVALALQRERLAETRGALDAEKSALGASLDTALRAAEAVAKREALENFMGELRVEQRSLYNRVKSVSITDDARGQGRSTDIGPHACANHQRGARERGVARRG